MRLFSDLSDLAISDAVVFRKVSAGASKLKDEVDLGLFSIENFKIAADENDDEVVAALKHFWHKLLVEGLPMTPQLLTQCVRV
ncbi:hypothetical protein ACFX2B_029785 [Malus domestica]